MSAPPALAGGSAAVTGASRGIGRAIAAALAAVGARVALLARSADELGEVAREIGQAAIPLPCDVTRRDDVDRAAARLVDELGGAPDVLVNAAGDFMLAPIERSGADEFARILDVNLTGPFLVTRAFLPVMRARGRGHVVTIGSAADRVAYPENGAYAASKFGVRGLMEVLRAELRGTGVRVTLVSPGPTDTGLWDAHDPDRRPGFIPRARMLDAADVARAVVYAVSQPPGVNVDELRLSPA